MNKSKIENEINYLIYIIINLIGCFLFYLFFNKLPNIFWWLIGSMIGFLLIISYKINFEKDKEEIK